MRQHPSGLLRPNPVNFIDYSTEPYSAGQSPEPFLLADLSTTISRYLAFSNMSRFYERFPLHEIIALLLSTSTRRAGAPGAMDFISFTTEEYVGDLIHEIDIDGLFIFYDRLSEELEHELLRKTPTYGASDDYIFYRWLDPVSVCFCLEHVDPIQPRFMLSP